MSISYSKLFKLLEDKRYKKSQLEEMAKISHYTMHQLRHNRHVSTETLGKICGALGCRIEDIVEFIDTDNEEELVNGID